MICQGNCCTEDTSLTHFFSTNNLIFINILHTITTFLSSGLWPTVCGGEICDKTITFSSKYSCLCDKGISFHNLFVSRDVSETTSWLNELLAEDKQEAATLRERLMKAAWMYVSVCERERNTMTKWGRSTSEIKHMSFFFVISAVLLVEGEDV